jgi:plastocyanin
MHESTGVLGGRGARRRISVAIAGLAVAASAAAFGLGSAHGADGTTEAPATVWDYRTVFIVWDEEAQDWRADWTAGPSTIGLEAILDIEGSVGWELIDVAHERFDTILTDGATTQEARRLRLIFKREGAVAPPARPLVSITGFSFQPATLETDAGATVRWENQDGAAHTVTSSDGTFDSGRLSSGDSFEFTFGTAGTFAYACAIHPSMVGTVVVG